MLGIIIPVIVFTALLGLGIKFYLGYRKVYEQITWIEYGIALAIIIFLQVPLTTFVGWRVSVSNKTTFSEFWNGWETGVQWEKIQCSRDGPCWWEYDCDPYIVVIPETSCDSKGVCTTSLRTETHYHSCPYCEEEWTFTVNTTLGQYIIAEHRLPDNPQRSRWQPERRRQLPNAIIQEAGVGVPKFWQIAKDRIDANRPGPVTARREYVNYILASENSILRQYSKEIERFKVADLLPNPVNDIFSFYYSDKTYFVGYSPADAKLWQWRLMNLNAALGDELEGDLHLVIVQNGQISENPDAYLFALKAHWQNTEEFRENSISKNAIIVIIGTNDGKTVAWARAITGMPLGNEYMLLMLQNNLRGIPLTADAIIGSTYRQVKENRIQTIHGNGVLERVLWGLDEVGTKFVRVSMSGTDPEDVGTGFLYLKGEIHPSKGQKAVIIISSFVLSLIAWVVVIYRGGSRP